MIFKLVGAGQGRWACVNGSQLVALVRAGARFETGTKVERLSEQDQEAPA